MSSFVDMKAVMSASDEMMQGAAEDLAEEMGADYLNEAENLLVNDPDLSMPEHSMLANVIFNNVQNYMTKRS